MDKLRCHCLQLFNLACAALRQARARAREREREREADRDRDRHRQTDRLIYRYLETERE